MTYWVIFPEIYDDGAVLSAVPEGGPQDYQYDEGKPLLKRFPSREEAVMCFDPSYPEQIKLYDFLPSLDSVLVANEKVVDLLKSLQIDKLEFLPISLWDHNNKPVSSDYYIINTLGSINFIDMEKSTYRMGAIDESQIKRIKNLVINEKAIESSPKLFRATTKLNQFFIHDDVRKAFEENNITGYKLFAAEGWDGLDI